MERPVLDGITLTDGIDRAGSAKSERHRPSDTQSQNKNGIVCMDVKTVPFKMG